jgi:integrase
MASGPHFDKRRGAYRVQWFDGYRWRRATVYKVPGWKSGQPEPKKVPPEAQAAVLEYAKKERAAKANRPIDPTTTVIDFLSAYRESYARDHAGTSAIQLDQAIKVFRAWCRAAKVEKLDAIATADCQRFLDWRAGQTSRKTGEPISPTRLNHERTMLSGAWARAVKLGSMKANPWTPTEAPGWERHRKRKKERPHWTPEQFLKLMKAARPWLRDVLTLGTQTGLRITALCNLEWRDVRWSKDGKGLGEIVVRPELDKAGRGYSIPLSRRAHDLLMQLDIRREPGREFVLTAARGGPVLPLVSARSIRWACRQAGLAKPTSPNHHMRRTFGRWAILGQLTGKPIPMFVVMKWYGHSNIETTQSYLDMVESDSQDWMQEADQPDPSRNDSAGQVP